MVVVFCLPVAVGAESVRWKPAPRPPNTAPEFDGPGSFGALHGTVTLGSLQYVGSIRKSGVEVALIRDETGVVHQLRLGGYVGENSGIITRIDSDALYITQLVNHNGRIEEKVVKFTKHGEPAK